MTLSGSPLKCKCCRVRKHGGTPCQPSRRAAHLAKAALPCAPDGQLGQTPGAQVVGYAVARPAREVLFTAPATRRERTAAKLCLDTLVVRAGDSAAAALFHVLDSTLELGALTEQTLAGLSSCSLPPEPVPRSIRLGIGCPYCRGLVFPVSSTACAATAMQLHFSASWTLCKSSTPSIQDLSLPIVCCKAWLCRIYEPVTRRQGPPGAPRRP